MARSHVFWRLCLSVINQAAGAPFLDKALSREIDGCGRSWRGYAIQLTPWRRGPYGEATAQKALFIGLEEARSNAPAHARTPATDNAPNSDAPADPPPVDRSAIELSGGGVVTPDHRQIKPESGQQKGYVVLTPAERAKGFKRPYRDAYRHLKCGAITTMSRDIAETYARDPHFYSGTFCIKCRGHFPVGEDGEFTWYEMDGREGPKVGE